MMTVTFNPEYRALVVDDDVVARRIVTMALESEGIVCDSASDGDEAASLIATRPYDLVIIDLLMPQKHGHALAVELLAGDDRPSLIVHTSVSDLRLTKDLLVRGVDDVVYKPTDYAVFAARAHALAERRRARLPGKRADVEPTSRQGDAKRLPSDGEGSEPPLAAQEIEQRLAEVSTILPISETALSVYRLALQETVPAADMARAIAQDAALAADILKMGNSPQYNWSGKSLTDLDEVVVRIGARRVSELALAAGARSVVTRGQFPWLNIELAWRRSIAAGIVLDALVEQGGHQQLQDGLFLSTLMSPLGRVVLASLFPVRHEKLARQCQETGEPLSRAEKRLFLRTHVEILADLLARWRIPGEVTEPLRHVLSVPSALRILPERQQMRVELLQVAIQLGSVAVGEWEAWDAVEYPRAALLERLGIQSVTEVIAEAQAKMGGGPAAGDWPTEAPASPRSEVAV